MNSRRNSNRLTKYAPIALLLLASLAILIVALVRILGGGKTPVPGDSSANAAKDSTNTADSGSASGTAPAGAGENSDVANSSDSAIPGQVTDNTPAADQTNSDILPAGENHPSDTAAHDDNSGTGSEAAPDNSVTEETGNDNTDNSPSDVSASFYAVPVSDEIFARIKGKSYPEGCTLDLNELRYVHVLHYDFDGNVREGEVIVNTAVAEDIVEIFRELYDIRYPIEKMTLIDAYDADDERSMEDNNTSAFNYRFIAESTTLSNHALGLAIDINPLYNPYVYTRKDGSIFLQPYNAGDYVDREKDNPYYIRRNDDCYNIFISHGFTWGGDWNTKKDYQHFEKAK